MDDFTVVSLRLLMSLLAGSIIGFERAYNGRPAGLRTHTLVCMSSSLLMLLTVYQWDLLVGVPIDTIRVDPTRMAQGVMTGIGFLGAGVIMKEKFCVRGLTTAASIWMTASIGIIVGMGFFLAGMLATVLTLVILSVFGWIEKRMPVRRYSRLIVRFKTRTVMKRTEIDEIINRFAIRASNPSYQLEGKGRYLEYRMTIFTNHADNFQKLAHCLSTMDDIHEFTIMPTGE
ncbi:MAG: MgtC/SapB family protein [Gammaproteobacteria bacterium]|nr:MgtC/SapB family protein [Gammaproteobacteria bacterium]